MDVAAHIISIIKAQPQTSNSLVSVKSPYISPDDQSPTPSLNMQTEILPYQVEDSVVTPLLLDTTQPNNETLTDKAIPQVNTKSLHDELQEFSTENDGNNQRKEIITRRHSIETEQPKHYKNKKTITRTFSLQFPRPQSLDEGFFSHHSTPESEEEEWSDSEDESLIDIPLKRFSRSSSLAPLDPQYYSRRSSDASNLDSSDEVAVVTFPPLPITQEQSSTTHTVVDQVVVYNVDNKQGVSENNIELHEYENPSKLYKTKRQKRSIAVQDIFDENNLGLEELFKEKAVPIVANVQLPEPEYHTVEQFVDKPVYHTVEQLVANVLPQQAEYHAHEQHHTVEYHVANVLPLVAVHQAPTKRQKRSIAVHDNVVVVQNEVFDEDNLGLEELFKEKAVPIVANEQLPEEEHHAIQPLEAVPQPPADVVHVENNPPAVQPLEAEHDIFDEDNLGLEELFKEDAVPIVANDQPQEAEHDTDGQHVDEQQHADEHLAANDQPPEAEHHADGQHVDEQQHADEHLAANDQPPEAEHHADGQHVDEQQHADEHLAANDQPPEAEHHADGQHVDEQQHADEHLAANDQPPEAEHHADGQHVDEHQKDEHFVTNEQPLAAAPQTPLETIALVEKKSYIPPINFDIEQNIAKYTTYIEFDYLDLISNALSSRNNLLKHDFTVNMVAAGDNDYYIKKGGWIQVMRSTSKQKGNTLPFKNNQQGFVLGFDAQPLDELIIGIAYANANSYTKFQNIFNDKQNIILHVAAVYSKYTLSPNMYLSSYLKYGKAFIKNLGKRDTISINSKTNGYVGRAKLETHYKVDLDKFLFKPMVGIIFDRFLIKNFTEYRKDFNINVPTRKGKRVSFETGIDFSKRILVKNISIIPKVHFKLDQTILLNNSTDIINFTSIEHHTQTVAITKSLRPSPKNVMYTLGGCINMQSVSALELGAGYDYSLKKSFTTHSFYVNGSVKF
ncbi:autotransporter domain-containing protein [Candidatus Tisiphia endosymbiont of Thecophora atra]|uniref:autotransporter outer membrane beta-barrel domain-containing protein n=1 Tax=Candidatus Tisiphia endosymbiont of Thecophora atra TaxID=3066258 RepID=UPI00312C6E5A